MCDQYGSMKWSTIVFVVHFFYLDIKVLFIIHLFV